MATFPNPETQFVKGQSGNPSGKPKGTIHSSTRLKRILDLVQKKKNPVTGHEEEFTVLEQMDLVQISKALKGDSKAYAEILDRLEGKAKQTIDQNNSFVDALAKLRAELPDFLERGEPDDEEVD
jgi:hypothetical protein